MPIYRDKPAPFECVICGRQILSTWAPRSDYAFPPLCWACEQKAWRGGPTTRNPDRRLIKQIKALEEALTCEASQQVWEAAHHV